MNPTSTKMAPPAEETLTEELHTAVNELLHYYGGPASGSRLKQFPPQTLRCGATVDLNGPGLEVLITLMTDAESPVELGASGGRHGGLDDWVGELANQASGRFRNKATRLGVNVEIGLPAAISSWQAPAASASHSWEYVWGGRVLVVAAELSISGELSLESKKNELVAEEGSITFF